MDLSSVLQTRVLIIGAGPAGLSFGYSYSQLRKDFIIIDMGRSLDQRNRNDGFDCVAGLGGAGLFSDGKFSFFPSGTNIWKLTNQDLLKKAYGDLTTLFKDSIDFEVPNFPDCKEKAELGPNKTFELKEYPSFYISLQDRKKLVEDIMKRVGSNIRLGWQVLDWESKEGKYYVRIQANETVKVIVCEYIILAGGRFHPLLVKNVPKVFKRYEYGVRLVGENSEFESLIDPNKSLIDPKWIFKPSSDIEFRTFCVCKDGEYTQSDFMGITSYSGRADIPPSGITNFGLTLRLKKKLEGFEKVLECKPFEMKLSDLFNDSKMLSEKFGTKLSEMYLQGMSEFLKDFKLDAEKLKIIGPSIEGVGEYPAINENLQVSREKIFAIGDCSGIFRGIIPSMISGHFVGLYLTKEQ